MIMNAKTLLTVGFTDAELDALTTTINIVKKLQHINPQESMMNMTTGEVIEVCELDRVCGILSGIRDREHPNWLIEM